MLYYHTRSALTALVALSFATSAVAAPPNVVTDIAPVHSLAALVMDGVATPELVVPANTSPHGFSMRPSQAAALENADIVFWMGHELTPWLEKPLNVLPQGANVIALLDAEGTKTFEFRDTEKLASAGHDDHDDHAKKHDDHDEKEHADHDDHDKEEHADHDEHKEDHKDEGDDHDHAHDHDGIDPHAWLDPENAITWIGVIADQVAAKDPENAATYKTNAEKAVADIRAASAQIKTKLAPLSTQNFIVFHDAYQYFETRFGLSAVGSIALGDAEKPSPARLSEIRETLNARNVSCVFSEPQFNSGLVATVVEGTTTKTTVLDPLGAGFTAGTNLYLSMLNGLADQFATCLKP